jgi:tRNA threonylcarbamoyladenosine modification (KEOPS) complex  Pcc1 subunit
MTRKRSSVTIQIVGTQLMRQVLDGMKDRFAASIQRAVEREMRQLFRPRRKSTPNRKTRSRAKTRKATR